MRHFRKGANHARIHSDMNTGNVLGIVGCVVGTVGLIASAVFYIRSRRSKEMLWATKTSNLIRNYKKKLPDLDISYKGHPTENLSVSRLLLWNAGPDAIRRQDMEEVSTTNRLRIEAIANVKLLDVTLLETNAVSQLSAQQPEDQRTSFIDFLSLNKGQGAVFQIVHTGVKDSDIRLNGEIVGAGTPRRARIRFPQYPHARTLRQKLAALPSSSFTYITIIGLIVFATFLYDAIKTSKPSWVLLAYVIIVFVIYPLTTFLLFRRTPHGLRTFEDTI